MMGTAEAAKLLARGDFRGARAQAEARIVAAGEEPGALKLAGLACCNGGDLGAGAAYLRRAVEADPSDEEARGALASALAGIGALEEAELLCAGRTETSPGLLRVHAYVLQGLGRLGEAEAAYRRLVEADPRDFRAWTNLGNTLLAAGDAARAVAALERARSIAPNNALVQLNLAGALASAGRLDESLSAAREALRLDPRNAACAYECARALNRVGRHAEAAELMSQLVRAVPREPLFQLELGLALAGVGRLDEAERSYRAALAAKPDLLPAWLSLGVLYESSNQPGALARTIEEALAAGIDARELKYLSALSLKREGRFAEALPLAEQSPPTTDPADKAQLVGEIADRLGDPERAFESFREMNRLVAAHSSNPRAAAAAYRRSVDAVAALTTEAWFNAWAPAEPRLEPPAPVFLVGFPRSGTTLLDTMLMGHERLHVMEELPVLQKVNEAVGPLERLAGLGAVEIEQLRVLYFQQVDAQAPGRDDRIVIDKFPLAIGLAPLIKRIFPDARFIFAERHPYDVVLSCFITRFGINGGVANFLDLRDTASLYDQLLGYWQQAKRVLGLDVHALRYERLVEDPERELRPLVRFLRIDWDQTLLDSARTAAQRGYVSTPSYAQVTEGLYRRAAGRWRRYHRQLEPVLPLLRPWAEQLGYETEAG